MKSVFLIFIFIQVSFIGLCQFSIDLTAGAGGMRRSITKGVLDTWIVPSLGLAVNYKFDSIPLQINITPYYMPSERYEEHYSSSNYASTYFPRIIVMSGAEMLVNFTAFAQNNQTMLSEYWSGSGGKIQTPIFSTLVTKTDDLRNVYVAGASLNPNTNKLDMMIQKFNFAGHLLWQTTYSGALNQDDMAADLFVDDNYNVYVTGAVAENAQNHYELAVVKFNSSGSLQWDYFYNYGGTPLPYDAGTAITGNDDFLFVTGSSAGNNTNSDYVVIKLEAGNGNEVWTQRYDYDGFDDVPAKIKVSNTQEIIVSGGSQISETPAVWERATIKLEPNGQFINDFRTGQSVTGGRTSKNGLYKIGVNNSSVELLIPFCDTKRYESISASPDGKHLIGERIDSHLELDNDSNSTGAIIENSSIYLIDLNTLEETKINLEP